MAVDAWYRVAASWEGGVASHDERLLRRGDYIWGSWVKPERVDGWIVGINPGDVSDVLGRFPFSVGSIDDAVEAATRGGLVWRRTSRADRARTLGRFCDGLRRFQERLAALVTRETGKPLWESRQEVVASIRAVDLLLEEGMALLEPRIVDERDARSDYRPRGVVGVVAPYNLPLLVPAMQCAAALLAGNTVVLKPSKFAPATGQMLAEIFDRCRLPRGVFNLVQGSGSIIGRHLATHPGVDALLVSASYKTAGALRQATFDRPELPLLLQSGGKGAAIVLDDCDFDRAVYEVMVGAFLTAGQRHNSTARVIVVDGVHDRFVEALVSHSARLEVGYGFEPGTFMGPLVSESLRSRHRRFGRALSARSHGALAGVRDATPEREGHYVAPAIYAVDWENGPAFLEDEPPGPLLLVYRVAGWQEAVALHNQLAFRLSTALFVRPDRPELPEIVARLQTGALHINRGTIGASMRLPAVGLGRASNGLPGGLELLRFLSAPRATLVETRAFDPGQLLPGVHWVEDDDDPITIEVELEHEIL